MEEIAVYGLLQYLKYQWVENILSWRCWVSDIMSYIKHSNFNIWNLQEYWSNFSVVPGPLIKLGGVVLGLVIITRPMAVQGWQHQFLSGHCSQATLSMASTWMGDCLAAPCAGRATPYRLKGIWASIYKTRRLYWTLKQGCAKDWKMVKRLRSQWCLP